MYRKSFLIFLVVVFVAFILYAIFKKKPEMMTADDIPLPQVEKSDSLKSLLEKHLEDHKTLQTKLNEPKKHIITDIIQKKVNKTFIPEPLKMEKSKNKLITNDIEMVDRKQKNMINEPVRIVSLEEKRVNGNRYVIQSMV